MSFSGGVYTLPGPALVTGEVVSATENNQFRNDVAGAFNVTMLRNGTSTATANLPMGGFKLTGLGAATTNGDALSYGNAAVVTTLTSTSLTATRVPYAGTGGLLQDASTFTFDGTTLTAGGFTTSGAISAGTITASGAITVSGGTANGVAYLNGSKVLTTGNALTFDGANLAAGRLLSGRYTSDANGWGIQNYATNAYGSGIQLVYGGAGAAAMWVPAASSLAFGADAGAGTTEQMRLTSTGLGIGTSSPQSKLHITGNSSSANVQLSANYSSTENNNNIGLKIQVAGYGTSGAYPMFGIAPDYNNANLNVLFEIVGNSLQFTGSATKIMSITQSGNVGIGTSSPNASAILDVQSTTKGVRFPNMTTTQKTAISSPAAGLVVFDTTLSKLCVYSGAAWQTITSV